MTVALQWTVFLNVVMVIAPPTNTTSEIIQTLKYSNVEGAIMVPVQIENVIREPSGLETLRKLNYIYFAGSTLPRSVAEKLVSHCKVQPGMGTTEAGAYFLQIRNEDDWEYYRFRDSMGIEMVQRTDELYELVFKRRPELARWQQLFQLYPELNEYPTKDLWTRHPTRFDLWRYGGRADDLVNFTHGESLYATPLEATIQEHPNVQVAIVGGEGRSRPFVMIELAGGKVMTSEMEREAKLDDIWPYIERANERCADVVKIAREHVLFTDPEKPLPRTAKDTILRGAAISLYSSEIDVRYADDGA
jgi:acyl-coenzyme A synthetase/AMP-(fatty) acid ligase